MKKSYIASAAALLLVSGSLMAQTIVTVNGAKIDSKDIDYQVKLLQSQNPQVQDSAMLRRNLTERQVTMTLVAQEAKRLKLEQSAEYKQALEQARAAAKQSGDDKKPGFPQQWSAFETALQNQAYIAHVLRGNPVTENDVKKAYGDFSKFYRGSHEVQLGEILTRNAADAQKAIADLKAKKDFKAVAKQYTADPRGKQTGGLNAAYVNLKDLEQGAPAVYAAVKNLNKGGYTTTPLEDGNGLYGVFYINDKRAAKVPDYETAKNGIAQELQAARVDGAIESLYRKAKIQNAR
ncbi:hypothetical protein BWD09_02335 [Neisseria dentiae]|uniref:peptidylprolyl isomerase n=1 Tax=Neisseria dentiae TaxID=194197 RepID=A0A1X3DFY5_9NEIS|nr:peptidyl-prolyl cis-trans isomerase [Neisseria dentiae]OSI18621.1 hypothetical protein BWD09_02335 [Neisseria dentiae]QMT45488.1 peptidyl-prolyl cis-trans isomerase [Neisseria dentiae]STZ51359.1 Cell-binding factor, putative [Neisseria dentiae]